MPDVVVVGAGAAGLGAARRLRAAGADALVLEAKDRVGGRAHALAAGSGAGIDLGCGWLHSADRNPLVRVAESLGFAIDRSIAPWMRPALDVNFPLEDQAAYRQVFEDFEDRVRREAERPDDIAVSDLFGPDEAPWRALLNAFSGFYNGAPFDCISLKDYAAYEATEENWRVRAGYGALIGALSDSAEIRLNCPVRRIEQRARSVRVTSDQGLVEASSAIVCVPTAVLARELITFDPPLANTLAAAALPLGHVEKAFLKLDTPDAAPLDTHAYGRTDTAETGSYTLRPMGLPVIECFFGGDLAASLEEAGGGALTAFALTELGALFGSAFTDRLKPLAQSAWRADPFIGGAYSHARVGETDARARLAASAGERLFFAGEACSPHAFSTAHGAYETGLAAAESALALLRRDAV